MSLNTGSPSAGVGGKTSFSAGSSTSVPVAGGRWTGGAVALVNVSTHNNLHLACICHLSLRVN